MQKITITILLAALILLMMTLVNGLNSNKEITINALFCPAHNCAEFLIEHLQKNEGSKCVFYDLNHKEVINYLNKTNASVLVFNKNYKGFGKKVSSRGLMHHKFCVLNETHTIITSANPTYNDLTLNTNNLLLINSKALTKNYLSEYYFIKDKKTFKTNTKIESDNIKIQNYFCPKDNCKQKIEKTLNSATKSIHYKTFTFTDNDIANILINKNKSGVYVFGVTENFQNHNFWVVPMLKDLIVVQRKTSKQHSKVFVIDEKIVITGSYNPTNAANTINNENILIIKNQELASFYVEEIKRILNEI